VYLNKTIDVSGVPAKVEKDAEGRYFLVAAATSRYVKDPDQGPRVMSAEEYHRAVTQAALNTKYMPGIMLYLREKDLSQLAGLDSTKGITVRGVCKGTRADSTTKPAYVVIMEECTLAAQR
jgi:hypothetical protein